MSFLKSYKNKMIFLLSLIAVLLLLYTGSFVFSPENINSRHSSFVWMDQNSLAILNRIVIKSGEQDVELIKRNQRWFALNNGIEYPARAFRIEDFLEVFARRDSWPVRSNSASSHASLGLDAQNADRVTIYSGNTSLLDVLIGYDAVSGREVYIRRYAQNEVRSGDNRIKTYITSPVSSWFNLKLFMENDEESISADSVQRLTVYNEGETQVISQSNRAWSVSVNGEIINQETTTVENYIRGILTAEGDNFATLVSDGTPEFSHSRIVIEFGNGIITTVNFSEPDEETGLRLATVSGKDYIYSIPAWVSSRLFRKFN